MSKIEPTEKLVYHNRWDDDDACWHSHWTLEKWRKGLFGWRWETEKNLTPAGYITILGDGAWAKKIANHYNITHPLLAPIKDSSRLDKQGKDK